MTNEENWNKKLHMIPHVQLKIQKVMLGNKWKEKLLSEEWEDGAAAIDLQTF